MKTAMASLLVYITVIAVGCLGHEVQGKLWEDTVTLSKDEWNSGKNVRMAYSEKIYSSNS